MRELWDKQLVLVTGKGGVGKTTLTAALARAAHEAGRRVLVTEVAPDVHNPSPVLTYFGQPQHRGEEPLELSPGLFGVRLTPPVGHRQFLREALKVRLLVDAAMRSAALTRFLMAAPTFPEIGLLYQLVTLLRSRRYDHVIVDLPATGHAVALASLPRVVHRIVPSGLIGDAIGDGIEIMSDPQRTSAVVITLPESMPVTETKELIAALERCDIKVGGAILNRLPEDPFTGEERDALAGLVRERRHNGRPRVLGTRELRRLERAHEAKDQFRRDIPDGIPRYEVPLFETTDSKTIAWSMADVLARAGAED